MKGPSHRNAGLTLVELLLAISIAILLITLLYSIYHTVAATAQGQEQRHRRREPATALADLLLEDLQAGFAPAQDDACAFSLVAREQDGNPHDEFAFCSISIPTHTSDPAWGVPIAVSYRVIQSPRSTFDLVRVYHPLAGGDALAPVTNMIVSAVTSFDVALYDGTLWHDTWPPFPDEDPPPPPRATRIACEAAGMDAPFNMEVFLPVGNAIEPPEDPEREDVGE